MSSHQARDPGARKPADADPGDPGNTDLELDRLFEDYSERRRRGERCEIEDYVLRRPELATEIRRLFPTVEAMEGLGGLAEPRRPAPRRIGDFRIVREAGRGGMGVVHEAVQETLGRRVALKLLPPELAADARRLERFRREARAAARLHHTNIVPVFDVGVEDGIHYYAMQFIEGRSLDGILTEARARRARGESKLPALGAPSSERISLRREGMGSSSNAAAERGHERAAARIALQVADALAYAHGQGVLHRDIKPSNLLLDARGIVWITDFGLAKAQDADSPSPSDHLTQEGDIVGTIAYLAPERLEGTTDERSDVYSLGLTLHEMLTLEPAFQDDNRRRLLKRVAEETPASPRQRDPTISRDLETIVLTATAREPSRRYASARKLAEDLDNYLAGRPIAARRASPLKRLTSWCRREPRLALLTASVLVLLTLIASLSSFGYLKLHELLGSTKESLSRARTAEAKAVAALRNAYLAQAHSLRISAAPGRRLDCLDAIGKALTLRPGQEQLLELRAEAIAALALADLRLTRRWSKEPIFAFAVSPLGETYAVATPDDRAIQIRKVEDQSEVARLAVVGAAYGSLIYSPDGAYLAARLEVGPSRLAVFDLATREQVHSSSAVTYGTGVAFASEARVLAHANYRTNEICVVNLAEPGEQVLHPGWPGFWILDVSRDGTWVGLASDRHKRIRLLRPSTGEIIVSEEDDTPHRTISLSPDGRLVAAACDDNSVSIWRLHDGALSGKHKLERSQVTVVKTLFNPRGSLLASYSWDPVCRLWDPHTGDLLLSAYWSPVGFTRDGHGLACELGARSLGLAEVAESEVYKLLDLSPTPRGNVFDQDVSPDGRWLACTRKEGSAIIDLETGIHLPPLPVQELRSLVFSDDGKWLYSGSAGGLSRWPVLPPEGDGTRDAPPGQAGERPSFRIGLPTSLVELTSGSSRRIARSADSKTLAIVGSRAPGEIVVTHLEGTSSRKVILQPHWNVDRIALRPDGKRLASGTWNGRDVNVWNTETGTLERKLPLGESAYVEYSPDGKWLVVLTADTCSIHDATSLEVARTIEKLALAGYTGQAAFRDDGKVLAITYDSAATLLLDPATGERLALLESPAPIRGCFVFRPDGSHLYVSTLGGDVHDWNLGRLREKLRELGLDWKDPAE